MSGRARWLFYALGGGLGHLTRAVSLARVALARGHAVTVVVNTAFADRVPYRRELPGADVVALSPALDRAQVARRVRALVDDARWDALVVDTFPRGLGGELAALLPTLRCGKVLVHRLLCPEYVAWAELARFVGHYDRILVPGEPAPFDDHPRALVTAPWLIRDAAELLDRAAARRALSAPPGAPLVLVTGTGRDDEIRASAALARALATALPRALARPVVVRFCAPGADGARWPLLPLLTGVDLLIGAGGYNTVQEARATATPLLALARPRRYDRQAQRLRPEERAEDAGALVARAISLLAGATPEPAPSTAPAYENGVHRAILDIERVVAAVGAS